MTIHELKKYLQGTLQFLEKRFDEDDEVKVVQNTYWLSRNGATHILETRQGFIDLDNPIGYGDEDDEWNWFIHCKEL